MLTRCHYSLSSLPAFQSRHWTTRHDAVSPTVMYVIWYSRRFSTQVILAHPQSYATSPCDLYNNIYGHSMEQHLHTAAIPYQCSWWPCTISQWSHKNCEAIAEHALPCHKYDHTNHNPDRKLRTLVLWESPVPEPAQISCPFCFNYSSSDLSMKKNRCEAQKHMISIEHRENIAIGNAKTNSNWQDCSAPQKYNQF